MLIDLQAYINIPSPSANYRIILDILVGHLSRIHVHRIANRTRRGALSENPGPLNCAWPSTRNTTFPRPACVAPRAFRPFRPEWRYVCPSPTYVNHKAHHARAGTSPHLRQEITPQTHRRPLGRLVPCYLSSPCLSSHTMPHTASFLGHGTSWLTPHVSFLACPMYSQAQ